MEIEKNVKRESVADLRKHFAEYNPRKVTDKKLDVLDESLYEFGSLDGIILNLETGNVVSGHQRLKVLPKESLIKKEKYTDSFGTNFMGYIETPDGLKIPYREVRWNEKKEKAANLAANNNAGEWSFPELADMLESLDDGEFNMEFTGFDSEDLERIFSWTPEDERKMLEPLENIDVQEKESDNSMGGERELSETNLNQVKINLTKEQIDYVDSKQEILGLTSRSQVLRMILETHMENDLA